MNLSNVATLQQLLPIAESAREDVSFFGYCYIHFPDQKTVLPIDSLASKTLELVRTTYNYTFTAEERAIGKRIAPLITKLYENNANRVNQKNWFTQALYTIREIWRFAMDHLTIGNGKMEVEDPGIRFQWEIAGFRSIFKHYTESQYRETFKRDPPDNMRWSNYYLTEGPYMWKEPRS